MASLVRPDNSRIELPRVSFDQETNTFVVSDENDDLQYPFRYALDVEADDDTYRILRSIEKMYVMRIFTKFSTATLINELVGFFRSPH